MQTIDHKEISQDFSTRLNVFTKVTTRRWREGSVSAGTDPSNIENVETERRATVSDAFAILFDAVNGPDRIVASVARESFAREHRTLQQAFVRVVVLPILEQLVADGKAGYFDARNVASVVFARKALESYQTLHETTGEKREFHIVPLPTI